MSREGLYRALSADGNPEFATILRVVRALGIRLSAAPLEAKRPRASVGLQEVEAWLP